MQNITELLKIPKRLKLTDFVKNPSKPPLGVGHFGKVWLVKYQPSSAAQDANSNEHLLI